MAKLTLKRRMAVLTRVAATHDKADKEGFFHACCEAIESAARKEAFREAAEVANRLWNRAQNDEIESAILALAEKEGV